MKSLFLSKSEVLLAAGCLLLAACWPASAQLILDPGSFTSASVGNPSLAGSATPVAGGFSISGAGLELGGTNDQFHFHYQSLTGDFDVALRVDSLSLADAWSRAGLMARDSLAGNSRHASALVTPGRGGSFFQARLTTPGTTTNQGSFPATYPNMWLRLKRAGTVFTGYAGVNGTNWTQLGTSTIATSPGTLLVGLAVSSRKTNQLATAQFRELSNITTNLPVGSLTSLSREPLGPSTRRTAFAISEIMYHPRLVPLDTNRSLEFIEVYNAEAYPEELGRHRLSGAIDFTFPSSYPMQPGQFVVIARDPAFVQSYYGITGVLGPWAGSTSNSLPGGAGLVRLRNPGGAVLVEVPYQGANPWPIAADGSGHSLVLNRPSYGEKSPKAWSASLSIDGSPGRDEPYVNAELASVRINEILAHTDDPVEDYVELYNLSNQPADVSGAWLSDEADRFKFEIPTPTVIPARGFVHFTQSQLGFALNAGGERVYLFNAARTRVIDAVDYEAQANGVSSGRAPDGAPGFSVLVSPTPRAANSGLSVGDIVINEVMYNPISGSNNDEYLELYNRSSVTQNLGGWRLRGGVSFNFPSNTLVAPGGYLVVAESRTNLLARYANLTAGNTVGDYSGALANGGERLALYRPERNVNFDTNTSAFVTNTIFIPVNEVIFGDGGRWGNWSDGSGSSLELVDPDADNRQPANWADSQESSKADWTNIELTGTLSTTTLGSPINDYLQIFLLGVGECLIDDVEVRVGNGANLVPNPGFETGITSWTVQGSHDTSSIEEVGFSGTRSLHLRAGSRGDNGVNRIRSGATPGLTSGTSNVTLRCKVKWLRGWPELLLRMHGGTLELSGRMNLPANLGTPGAPNSRSVPNAGPAIFDVVHAPALPAASETVVVTARAQDPDGVSAMLLRYRLDAVTPGPFLSAAMTDDGAGADAIAGDGVYSVSLPGQVAGAAIGFYVQAIDGAAAGLTGTNTFPQDVFPPSGHPRCFPYDSITKECLVRWGDRQMMGSFATYHLWGTLVNLNRWQVRDDLNNALLDGTFVYNNYRVIYNARPNFAGSPWHRSSFDGSPTNNAERMDYVCNFPEDDLLLGTTDTVLATAGNPGDNSNSPSDPSAQGEQTSYLMFREMGVQYNYRRYIHLFLNGNHRSIHSGVGAGPQGTYLMEDAQQPNGDMVEEWFPDDTDGELFKIEDWFEFDLAGQGFSNEDADLGRRENVINGKTVINPAPYRFMWRRRAVAAGDSASDYRSLFQVIDVVSPTASYNELDPRPIPDPAGFDQLADVEQWMRIFAVQHAVGNWDSYGYERGKNAYAYKPRNGRFVQWTWDIDFTMGIGHGATTDVFALGGDGDRRVQGMWSTPVFLRMYWRAFDDLVKGPWNNAYADPVLDAKAAAMTANGVAYSASQLAGIKSFINQRRTYLVGRLATVNAPFAIRGPTTTNVDNNLLVVLGTAPVTMRDIYLNGAYYPVTWTSVSNWTARIILDPGVNELTFQGIRPDGTPTTNQVLTVTANYSGAPADPAGAIVFSEINYRPSTPDASYVELYNRSTAAFDLAAWRVNGLDYEFPLGSILSPGQFLVLAKSPAAVGAAYPGATAFGQFTGNLDVDGETLSLLKPGSNGTPEQVIDKVRYENRLPWGLLANGSGAALQLVDAEQDNSRSSNWSDHEEWRYVTFTGNVAANLDTNFLIWLTNVGSIYIDDITMVTGAVANVGQSLLLNGGFEEPLSGPWTVLGNHSNSVISTAVSHSGSASLYVEAQGFGSPLAGIRQFITPFTNITQCTLSFWFRPTTNASLLTVRCRNGSTFTTVQRVTPIAATPGARNTVASPLPAYDPLWLNELQADNTSGPTDNQGERDPWLELYNAGDTPLDLSGYFLADNYDGNLTQWPFPAGATIGSKEFKIIWADGQPGQTAGNNLHASFRLNSTTGTVALVRLVNERPQITDYLTYANVGPGQSYGDYPDGQPFHRQVLVDFTPGSTNVARYVDVLINEWVAANSTNSAISDPADPPGSGFDDWFELYNAGSAPVDLGGFFLTDNPGNEAGYFQIPANGHYVIPPGGFLLVWADGTPEQNTPTRPDLHVPFQLAREGETIALYGADALTLIDQVQFGPQVDDVSEGRFPDGASSIGTLAVPTPRSSNVSSGGNTPPQVDPILSRTIRLGQTVSFTAVATDADDPPQTLTFSLAPVIPAGATIHPDSGLFTWTPTPLQAPSTNIINVRVTDNGVPPLSSTRPVTVIVLLGPDSSITRSGPNQVTLVFDTIPGRTYQIQYKNNLGDPQWLNLKPAEVAGGTTLSATDDLTANPQRFYRIVEVN